MNKITTLVFLSFLWLIGNGQVTYTAADYAEVGDSFHMSNANSGFGSFDFTLTGTNITWRYDSLPFSRQSDIRFIDPGDGGYRAAWCLSNGIGIGCNAQFNALTNLGRRGRDSVNIGSVSLKNIVDHYEHSGAVLQYKMLGATISVGGLPVTLPVKYDQPDSIYRFPMNYNNRDSANFRYEIDLNPYGIDLKYVSTGKRVNHVDGWGVLVTPFDSFPSVIKVKTIIYRYDTIYSGGGFNANSPVLVKYNWFDPAYGIQVLSAEGNIVLSSEVITAITYIDSARCVAPNALFTTSPVVIYYDSAMQHARVDFNNLSSNADSSFWDFGDGATSSLAEPTHSYACPGRYPVKLKIFNQFCDPYAQDSITIPVIVIDTTSIFTTTFNDTICNGDSIFIAGAYRNVAGTYYDTLMATGGCDSILATHLAIDSCDLVLSLKVCLQGATEPLAELMRDDLRQAGYISLIEPYTGIFTHAEPEGAEMIDTSLLSIEGDNAIVDWLFVELRDKLDSTHVLATRSVLLQRDGDVVDVDNDSLIKFPVIPPDHYYVAVRHRNHLGVMTGNPVLLSTIPVAVDFTDSLTATFGTAAQILINGKMCMHSGNVIMDTYVKYSGLDNDRDPILLRIGSIIPTNIEFGYHDEDVNMDGAVKYSGMDNDRDIILLNIGGVIPTAVLEEQIPF